jgi:uncharacterized protein YbdZ (MbtH family)
LVIAVSSGCERPAYYRVVVNDKGCYCIWPCDVDIPPDWKSTGFASAGEVALNQVAELWRARIERNGSRS